MPAVSLTICAVPVVISARSPRLVRLFADYFRYYQPQITSEAPPVTRAPLTIELQLRRALPPRTTLIPARAELFSQTGVVNLWRETLPGENESPRERFYFDLGVAAFRVDIATGSAIGLVTPAALKYPHILANTYALFALLLLLRSRGLYHLHAAAIVSPDDKLWLICGAQRAGKTTLTTALGLAGWQPVSDDSLLLSANDSGIQLRALKKYFHVGDELLRRWPALDDITRHHQYLDRTCVGGLEFFDATDLADFTFHGVDHLVLPQIVPEPTSRLVSLNRSDALLKLAEQSMFFQLWPDHTRTQWAALTALTQHAACHRLLSGTDLLTDPQRAAQTLLS